MAYFYVPAALNLGYHHVVIQLAQAILPKINILPDEHVLDVGCRNGKLIAILAQLNPLANFTGLTTSADYLNQTLDDPILCQLNNVAITFEDLYAFSYPNQFDKITSFSCLNWFEDKQKILANMYQSLKPGGTAYLHLFVDHQKAWFDECRLKVAKQAKWQDYFKDFKLRRFHPKPGAVIAMAENIGFIIEEAKLEKQSVVMPNAVFFNHWLKSISLHFIEHLKDKSEDFFDDVTTEYLKNAENKNQKQQVIYHDHFLSLILQKPLNGDKSFEM